ncbi:metallophosphoesterase [Neobacillus sp. PS3-34]|uniref:metallophosphoesterase n=1 Tax=Neobacillus sp. PS3-34 TaxID=3070678 RepID=UPI0027DEB84C|nr:metallophosphoesterase [Neobacillus sp. PS3-34]WML47827.1 metallophosphoesterase [Neobacillus sp. PS3-34]
MKRILIKEEAPKISRREFLKLSTTLFLSAIASTPFYSFFLERFWIEVNSVKLSFNRLPAAFSGIKIVQISDLHIGEFYGKSNLVELVKKVNSLKPDILCFTGDLVEDSVDILNECSPVLKQFRSNLLNLAILGNHDYRIGTGKKSRTMSPK